MSWDEDSHPRSSNGQFGSGGAGEHVTRALGLPTRPVSVQERQKFLEGAKARGREEANKAASKPGTGQSLKAFASKMLGAQKAKQTEAAAKLSPVSHAGVDKLVKGEALEHKYPNGTKARISVKNGLVHIDSDKSNVEKGTWNSGGSLRARAHLAIEHVLSAGERE